MEEIKEIMRWLPREMTLMLRWLGVRKNIYNKNIMALDKEKEIMRFAGWFLHTLMHKCLKECGRAVSAVQFPVFKKFLTCRVKRELQYYKQYLDLASVLVKAKMRILESDIDELMEGAMDIDQCLTRDIKFLPVRIYFDYEKILPLRRKRAMKQVEFFTRLLSIDGKDYYDLARKAFSKQEYLDLNNELLELYAEEAFIINSSLKSITDIDSEGIANRMYCSMLDIGIGMNNEVANSIFEKEQ